MTVMLLECPRCSRRKIWLRSESPEGPGTCPCGAWAPWHVILKKTPIFPGGFVKVVSGKGWQYLKGPHWREDPDGWKK